MSPNQKSILGLAVAVTFMWAFVLLLVGQAQVLPIVLCLSLTGLLVWGNFRRDLAPDHLKGESFFERDGFAFVTDLVGGADEDTRLQVRFQNRYSKPCTATVGLRLSTSPQSTMLPSVQHSLQSLAGGGLSWSVKSIAPGVPLA